MHLFSPVEMHPYLFQEPLLRNVLPYKTACGILLGLEVEGGSGWIWVKLAFRWSPSIVVVVEEKKGRVAAIYARHVRSHWLSLCFCVIRKYSVSLSHARCHGSALTEEQGRGNAAPVTLPTVCLLERHVASAATSGSSQEESDSVSVACGWGRAMLGAALEDRIEKVEP